MTVVLLLSFLNVLLEPLLVWFTLPFIGFTLGRGVVLINALLPQFLGFVAASARRGKNPTGLRRDLDQTF